MHTCVNYYYTRNKCGTSNTAIINIPLSTYFRRSAIEEKPTPTLTSDVISVKRYTLGSGMLVYSKKDVENFNIQDTKLNYGVYIVEKTDKNGNVTKEKFLKQ